MNSIPLRDQIIVKADEVKEVTEGGIIVTNKSIPKTGIVIKVGRGRYLDNGELIKPEVKEGDRVLFAAAAKIEINGEEYLLMRDSQDILVILKD